MLLFLTHYYNISLGLCHDLQSLYWGVYLWHVTALRVDLPKHVFTRWFVSIIRMVLLSLPSGIALSSTEEIRTGYGLTCRDPDGKFTLPYGPVKPVFSFRSRSSLIPGPWSGYPGSMLLFRLTIFGIMTSCGKPHKGTGCQSSFNKFL